MAKVEVRRPGGPPQKDVEPPYEGTPGRTKREAIHVPSASGLSHSVAVYRVVNVGTDPQLREPALSGALHRLESGETLAISFVFHDPAARKLAVVVPEALRHQELALRAKLLTEIAEHPEAAVPAYAREATSVVGLAALAAFLARPGSTAALAEVIERETRAQDREAKLSEREAALVRRTHDFEVQAEALTQRETRLKARAEEVTRREDELRTWSEEVEASQADIAMREQELESRFEALRQREGELAARAADSREVPRAVVDQEVVQLVDDEVEELDELEPLATSPGNAAPAREEKPAPAAARADEDRAEPTELAAEGTSVAALAPVASIDDVEELADEVEELEDLEPIGDVTGVHADLPEARPEPARAPVVARPSTRPSTRPAAPPEANLPRPSVAPPRGFLDAGAPEARAVREAGGVRVFVRAPSGRDDLFEKSPPNVLAQLAIVEECPIVLLTLVEDGEPNAVVRAALDARNGDDRSVLENLRRTFAVRVAVYGASGAYLRALEVRAPREVNVARILDRVTRLRGASGLDAETAFERVRASPPPVRAEDHPFVPVDTLPATPRPADAAALLARLARWSTHDELDHAILTLSIPVDQIDAATRAILERALEHGLPFPGRLQERAVSLGLAEDGAALVARQVTALAAVERSPGHGGLKPEQRAEAWEALLKHAAEQEYAIDPDTHELAWKVIRAVRGGDEGLDEVDAKKLPELGVPQLILLLEHPRHRQIAALELARRKDLALTDALCKAVRKMSRAEVVRVAPRIALLGEDAGDAIIDGLSARKTFVRQAFALALGHLKLRRAVVPLLHLLTAEESEVWREVARVIGSFGNASLRTVTRQLSDPRGREERLILTLAHLANHGCAKQIDKIAQEERGSVATMALEALTLRDRARAIDDQVRGAAPFTESDATLQFSRRFYAELEGNAPDHDLEEA